MRLLVDQQSCMGFPVDPHSISQQQLVIEVLQRGVADAWEAARPARRAMRGANRKRVQAEWELERARCKTWNGSMCVECFSHQVDSDWEAELVGHRQGSCSSSDEPEPNLLSYTRTRCRCRIRM